MKKFYYLTILVLSLTMISCNKKAESNLGVDKQIVPSNSSMQLSESFAELQSNLMELNHSVEDSSPRTRSIFRWLLVGISDAVGAACGFEIGGIAGAVILGGAASTAAIVEFKPQDYLCDFITNQEREEDTENAILSSASYRDVIRVGVQHNMLIRSLIENKSEDIVNMSSEELLEAFGDEAANNEIDNSVIEVLSTINLSELIFNPESEETLDAFINRLCDGFPDISQELIVLKTVLDGIDMAQADQDAFDYTAHAMQIISASSIEEESKATLLCGTSVAFESKLLWNLTPKN